MPGLANGIAAQVRSGEIKKFMIQPVDMIGFLLISRIAHKLVYYGVAFAPYALVLVVLALVSGQKSSLMMIVNRMTDTPQLPTQWYSHDSSQNSGTEMMVSQP